MKKIKTHLSYLECPQQESNPHHPVRSGILYPLSYGGNSDILPQNSIFFLDYAIIVLLARPCATAKAKATRGRAKLWRGKRVWFSGRTTGCQSVGGSSILPTRTGV